MSPNFLHRFSLSPKFSLVAWGPFDSHSLPFTVCRVAYLELAETVVDGELEPVDERNADTLTAHALALVAQGLHVVALSQLHQVGEVLS